MDVLARIKELMDLRGWTYYRLAKQMDKPLNQISDMFNNKRIPSIYILELICSAFGITLSEFFCTGADPVILTDRQRTLLHAYDSLDDPEKNLADAYVYGLARQPLKPPSHTESSSDPIK